MRLGERTPTIRGDGAGRARSLRKSSARFDGAALERPWIRWRFGDASTLVFTLSDRPTEWGVRPVRRRRRIGPDGTDVCAAR